MEHAFTRKKKSIEQFGTRKSPYFASVRRKSKMPPSQALSITKYPAINDNEQGKKKVFKRFSKFDNINDQPSNQKAHKIQQTFKSTPKDIVISSKTLELVDKYSSYKSIHLSASKIKQKDKEKNKKFRTKTRSGNSLSGQNSLYIRKETTK